MWEGLWAGRSFRFLKGGGGGRAAGLPAWPPSRWCYSVHGPAALCGRKPLSIATLIDICYRWGCWCACALPWGCRPLRLFPSNGKYTPAHICTCTHPIKIRIGLVATLLITTRCAGNAHTLRDTMMHNTQSTLQSNLRCYTTLSRVPSGILSDLQCRCWLPRLQHLLQGNRLTTRLLPQRPSSIHLLSNSKSTVSHAILSLAGDSRSICKWDVHTLSGDSLMCLKTD